MIYLDLFLGFLAVGCFSFGGAYSAIPLIRDVVMNYGWMSEETLTYMIAVSESTPGPIMVNLATYVGSSQAGLPGAIIATFAVVLPAFVIMLLLASLMKTVLNNRFVQALLHGLIPCVIGIVSATGICMILSTCVPAISDAGAGIDLRAAVITLLLAAVTLLYRRIAKKKLPPILLIVIAAVAGMVLYGF